MTSAKRIRCADVYYYGADGSELCDKDHVYVLGLRIHRNGPTMRAIVHLQGIWRRRRNRVLRLRNMQLHFDVVTFNGDLIWRECGVRGDQPVASLITKALERYPLPAGILWQRYVLLTGTSTMRWNWWLGDYLHPNCNGRITLVKLNTYHESINDAPKIQF